MAPSSRGKKMARSVGGKEAGQMRAVCVEERRQEAGRHAIAGDQRVGQQCLEGGVAIAVNRGFDRQPLVGLDLLDEAGQLGCQRTERRWVSALPIDARRNLHDGVVRQVGDRTGVADIDSLEIAGPGVKRSDQLGGSLAVVGAAALLAGFSSSAGCSYI